MDAIADLAERYSFDEVRVTPRAEPGAAARAPRATCGRSTQALKAIGLAEANAGLVTDIIACPGLDYCALANARSIPIAQRISERLAARQDADRRPQDQDLRLHQRLRPPPRRPHRHPGRREARRGALPAPARRLRRRGRGARLHHRPRLRPRRHRRRRREGGRHLPRAARRARSEPFLAAYGRLGPAPFKEALYARRRLMRDRVPLPACGERVRGGGSLRHKVRQSRPYPVPPPRVGRGRRSGGSRSGETAPSGATPG